MTPRRLLILIAVSLAGVALAGCGSKHAAAPTTTAAGAMTQTNTTGTTTQAAGALQPEAKSAATGDIPDNQVFLSYRSPAGFSIKYPEGWAQRAARSQVTFRDKNNIVRVVVVTGARPTAASVRRDVASLKGAQLATGPKSITISGAPAFKVVYVTRSAPNSVTGKRVELVVDRYYLFHAGREAIVDLGTPKGVDNVDAYRLMIESFRWK
ncbi:MAG: hypothetical protein M3R70_02780 [Actinomycetota bacterium]|nr:hypothetical protein [Actinomycetota bacterium]